MSHPQVVLAGVLAVDFGGALQFYKHPQNYIMSYLLCGMLALCTKLDELLNEALLGALQTPLNLWL
jgi:hypothetical protein